jgi:hypothetical protein
LLSHKLLNALINELSQIRRFKLLLFAQSIVMRSEMLVMIKLSDRFAIEGNFPMEILTSFCFHSIGTSRLLAFHIHGLRDFSVRITP